MLLDSEPKSAVDDIAIQIPSKTQSPLAAASVPVVASLDQREQLIQVPETSEGNAAASASALQAEPIAKATQKAIVKVTQRK